ncbi:hypothetical protein [Virgibacillus salexigens]|uniref:hypothetical protein n=1 Tax=Virgibacillus salexigens TaxID=61016 RepID=UPI00190D6FE3|nr:hypothetical protein [Virgibacillus salexigens]
MIRKKELDLQTEQHNKLITDIVEKSLAGITIDEIVGLKELCEKNRYEFYNRVKLKYIAHLGLLGIDYKITIEIEEAVFFFIHDIIHQVSTNRNVDDKIDIKIL